MWYEVFFKTRVSVNGLVIRKKVLSESSHRIETHPDTVVKVIGVHISVSFEFFIDEKFIEYW